MPKSSLISNPLSAITESPGSNKLRRPHFQVSYLYDIEPEYKSEIKVTVPDGDIPIKTKCFYFYNLKINLLKLWKG